MCAGLVSTIIPVFNRPQLLVEAVRSVLAQTYRPVEIIVVNDGSTDDTPQVAEGLAQENPGVIQVLHVVNRGAGAAREAGRQRAIGQYIQYLDSDDLLLPTKFAVQVSALEKHPDCGIAYGYTRLINERKKVLKAPYKWTAQRHERLLPALLVDRWWNTHTPLWRRSVCNAVGPWSEMRMSEDWEYEARAAALGVRLAHCPEYLSDTRKHEEMRLTGHPLGSRETADICRLIMALYASAKAGAISPDCPEMQHFSRWAFLISRQAAVLGMPELGRDCFAVARAAAGDPKGKGMDFRLYRLVAAIMGWRLAARVFSLRDCWGKKPGPRTLKQSWMEGEK